MRKSIVFGLAGIAVIWGGVAWVRAHGLLDLLSGAFIISGLFVLGWFTYRLAGVRNDG